MTSGSRRAGPGREEDVPPPRPEDAPARTGGAREARTREGMVGMRPGFRRAEAPPLPAQKVARAARVAVAGGAEFIRAGDGVYGVRSFTDEEKVYTVTIRPALTCDCPDAHYNDNICKHICLCLIHDRDPEAWSIAKWARFLPSD